MDRLKAFAAVIREARESRHLSQEKLAELAKLHRNFIGLLERCETTPSLPSLFAIADALDLPASELLAQAEKLAADRTA